jgi:hypothetical protein
MGNNSKKKNAADGQLFDMLRATGLRKKVARTVSASTAQVKDGSETIPSEVAHRTVRGLRMAAAAIENRISDDSTGHARKASSTGGTKKGSAGRKRAPSGARGTARKTSAPTRKARKTARPTAAKTRQRPTATRGRRTRARSSQQGARRAS